MRGKRRGILAAAAAMAVSAVAAAGAMASPLAQAAPIPFISFIGQFHTITPIASTVPHILGPGNGDVNPYGVAVIHHSEGRLVKGNVLVSNFNNFHNQQGTGTTIVSISPSGTRTLFAQVNAAHLPAPALGASASPPRCPSSTTGGSSSEACPPPRATRRR